MTTSDRQTPRQHVIVLGSGSAGMAAALAAAVAGAQVTVLERSEWLGGTTAISGAGIWIPANPWSAAAGVEDDAESGTTYLANLTVGDVDRVLGEAYVEHGVAAVTDFAAAAGLDWQHIIGNFDYHAELAGGSTGGRSLEIKPVEVGLEMLARVRPDPYGTEPWTINEQAGVEATPDEAELERRRRLGIVGRGRGLIGAAANAIERLGGEIRVSCGPARLAMDGRAVIGVDLDHERLLGRVVIATGGFERDPQLVATFLRGPMLAPAGPPTNTGEGLRMGMAAGAALGNMSEAWWCAAVHVPGETIDGADFHRMMFMDSGKPGGIVVDSGGRRFVNEAINYNEFGRALHELHAADYDHPRVPSWLVFDDARYRRHTLGFVPTPEPDGEWLITSPSIAQLATAIDVDPEVLTATVATFNADVERGHDAFGRGTYLWDRVSANDEPLRPIGDPPYYAVRLLPGCLGTKGGLRTDANGRVLAADGSGPIEGLFAAGNAAANPFGAAYPGPGSTVGPALVFGTLAGRLAAG